MKVKFKGTKTCYELEDEQGRVGVFTAQYIKEAVAEGEMEIPDELAQLLSVKGKSEKQVTSNNEVVILKDIDSEILKWKNDVEIAINNCEKLLKSLTNNEVDSSIKDGVYLIPYKESTYILYISDKIVHIDWKYKDNYEDNYVVSEMVKKYSIEKLIVIGGRNLTTCRYMFVDCYFLRYLDFSHFDTSKVIDMCRMFDGCECLQQLDVSHFDTSKVTSMYGMFNRCRTLKQLDFSHFDTSRVTIMACMFCKCSTLKQLDLSHFDTSKVTSMNGMFARCYDLQYLDVSHFNTSNVTDMSYMFDACNSLKQLDLSHFDTSKVTDMTGMFEKCKSLQQLDLSHFDTSKVTKMRWMFSNCEYRQTFKGLEKFSY